MKKFAALLLCGALLFGFAGCSETTTPAATSDAAGESTAQTAADTQPNETQSDTQNTQAQEENGTAESETTNAKNSGQTDKADAKTGTTRASAATNAPKTTAAQTTAEAKTLQCTVAIECTEILSHMDELDKSAARHVPDDGVLLQSVQVQVKNGATVYDALTAACKKGGVSVNAERSIYGTYIAGFNGINEKCCGSGSGWLYFVNGSSPSVACSAKKVQNGDTIEFRFTCG